MIRAWWRSRSAQEQRLIGAAAAVTAAVLVFQGIVVPIGDYRAAAADSYERSRQLYETVLPMARRVAAQKGQIEAETPAAKAPVRRTATKLARDMALDITRLQGMENEDIDIWLGNAEPAQIFQWLETLRQQHGIVARQAMLERAEGGAVTGRVTLRRGA